MKKYFGLVVLFLMIGLPLANAADELGQFDELAETTLQKDDERKPEDKVKVERFIEEVKIQGIALIKKYAPSKLTPEFDRQFREGARDFISSFYEQHPKITLKFIEQYFSRKEKSKKEKIDEIEKPLFRQAAAS